MVTLTVETGNADPDANSYASLDDFRTYSELNPFKSAAAAALSDDQASVLIIRASKYIDNLVRWNGTRVDQDSGLRWPRAGVYDADGFEIADDTIPSVLIDAVCELAMYLMDTDWTSPDPSRGLKKLQVDVIDIEQETDYVRPSLPDIVIDMLNALGSVNRGVRPAFKKVIRS